MDRTFKRVVAYQQVFETGSSSKWVSISSSFLSTADEFIPWVQNPGGVRTTNVQDGESQISREMN